MAFRTTKTLYTFALSKWAYNKAAFNRYGLYRDDVLYETEDVQEALRRLPRSLVDERNFRLIRAMQLSGAKVHLPKEEWTKFEEDHLYLSPMVETVRQERLEREQWEQNY